MVYHYRVKKINYHAAADKYQNAGQGTHNRVFNVVKLISEKRRDEFLEFSFTLQGFVIFCAENLIARADVSVKLYI